MSEPQFTLHCNTCRTDLSAEAFEQAGGQCPVCGNGTVQEINPKESPSPKQLCGHCLKEIHKDDAVSHMGTSTVHRYVSRCIELVRMAKDAEIARLSEAMRQTMDATGIVRQNPSDDLVDDFNNVMQVVIMKITEVADLEYQLSQHRQAVSLFLSDMYCTMIDPLAEGKSNVEVTCQELLKAATDQRQREHDKDELIEFLKQVNLRLRLALAPIRNLLRDLPDKQQISVDGSLACTVGQMRVALKELEPRALRTRPQDIFIDERNEVWLVPTAEAYQKVCVALEILYKRADVAEREWCDCRQILDALHTDFEFLERTFPNVWTTGAGYVLHPRVLELRALISSLGTQGGAAEGSVGGKGTPKDTDAS